MFAVRLGISAAIVCLAGISLALRPALQGQDQLLQAVMEADDRRDGTSATLGQLVAGTESMDPLTRRIAVRALGRAERPDWLEHLTHPLASSDPEVRAVAANAVGQSVFGVISEPAYHMLAARLAVETDRDVIGAIAQTIGRLSYGSVDAANRAERDLLTAASHGHPLLVTRGFESLVRQQHRGGFRLSDRATLQLVDWVRGSDAAPEARVRRMALAALANGGKADRGLLATALEDSDEGVRRLAVLGAASLDDVDERTRLIMQAPHDASPMVRYEILRIFGRFTKASEGCVPLTEVVGDNSPHVGLLAVDLMATSCDSADVSPILIRIAAALPPTSEQPVHNWHYPAHALVALSQVAPDLARQVFERFQTHSQWQVRMYAARAAVHLDDVPALYGFATDDHWNVRTTAITGLKATVDHDADSVYIDNLNTPDYQLVMTAAQALEGSVKMSEAVPALIAAMTRVTGDGKETSRDPRQAIISRLGELGSPSDAGVLRPYLSDFDPVIADSAASILSRWLDDDVSAQPVRLPSPPLPTVAQLRAWERTVVTLHMRGGQAIDLRLRPFDAPTNVRRFVRLAESGYFNSLTFHRVAVNFVIQGGSMGANEYVGDGPYSRDELTERAHWRGTVGLSTRGRDTGDGQIFVNLIDNVRLDHNYTIFAEVTAGMDVVDSVLEGGTIDRVSLRVVDVGG